MKKLYNFFNLQFSIPTKPIQKIKTFLFKRHEILLFVSLMLLSVTMFYFFYQNGLGLAYNDARSHLDIGRRVVEGLKPGLAQLGSVWLPLPHILMVPTIWSDFMWHTGLSGSIISMISFIVTSFTIYYLLRELKVGLVGRLFGVLVFVANWNILYLQSTPMTELLLLATMTMGCYQFLKWYSSDKIIFLIQSALWIMLSTLIRYDGWFLFFWAGVLVILKSFLNSKKKWGQTFKQSEGLFIFFCTLAGFGVFLWLLWNAAIFKDPFYFAFGPYSAHAQQEQLDQAGVLQTKGNLGLSIKMYWYAMMYNSVASTVVLSIVGAFFLWKSRLSKEIKIAVSTLLAPLVFNILALYLGHSVLFVQGLSGNTWFNIRYGIMMMPSIAVFSGFLVDRLKSYRTVLIGLFLFTSIFHFINFDSVTISDGRVGSSQKNVSEVSSWLSEHVKEEKGFVLISAASHDAIIFSSGLPMKRFIHEGTGKYWESATTSPDRWARWIVMRTNDENDQTFRLVHKSGQLYKYDLVDSYPFADIYQLKEEFVPNVQTEAVIGKQK